MRVERLVPLIAVAWGASMMPCTGGADPQDLTAYIEEIRAAGMSKEAESSLGTIASIRTGYLTIRFTADPRTGRYQPGSGSAPTSNAGPAEDKRWKEDRNRVVNEELLRLRRFADADRSGFVSTSEGSAFVGLVAFGYLAAQAIADGRADVESVAKAAGLDVEATREKLASYRALATRLVSEGLEPLPDLGRIE